MTSTIVNTFYVLDFDRCLGDTTKLQRELEEAIERKASISPAQLALARQEVERSGGSFDAGTYVQSILKDEDTDTTWDEICDNMIVHARQKDMLEPDARRLLDLLEAQNEQFGILTYGGTDWQYLKLKAACIDDVPVLITGDPNKGKSIRGWKDSDGLFAIPSELARDGGIRAKKILLVDDKAMSFQDIPEGVSGYHVLRSDRKVMPSQEGELPTGVSRVNGLGEVIKLLFSK